jgi:glycosyltransferase involved in cell wall biosynthesis
MKKILILAKPEYAGVSWYRHQQFAKKAKEQALADVQYINFDLSPTDYDRVINMADVVYTRLNPKLPEMMEQYNVPFVIDLDDSLDDHDPLSDTYRAMGTCEVQLQDGTFLWKDGERGFDLEANVQRNKKLKEALTKVHGATTTTLTLRNYIAEYNENVAIIPNAIDPELFADVTANTRGKDEIRMVWSGGSTHFSDLMAIKPHVGSLMEKYKSLHFYVVGTAFKGFLKELPEERVHTSPWLRADGHGFRLSCLDGDIGICPINDTPFNRNKSSVKYYEYSMAGMATVAAGIPPYTDDIADDINGLLYSDLSEFESKVVELIEDPLKRAEIASEGLKYVKKCRDVNDIAKDWVEYLLAVAKEYEG